MTGKFLTALREAAKLERDEVARRAGISEDQVARAERGENVGMWYVGAILAVLQPTERAAAGLLHALKMDGDTVIKSGELAERRRHPVDPARFRRSASDAPRRPTPPVRPQTQKRKT